MALIRDTLQQLIDSVRGDFAAEWPGADTTTRRSPLDIFSRVLGYVHHTVNGWLNTIAREMMANTARLWLPLHGALWKIDRLPASFAAGTWLATGTPGAFIPVSTRLRRGDGIEYTVDLDTVIEAGGTAQVPVVAAQEGAAANCAAGTPLTLISPLAGVTFTGTIGDPGVAGGADRETTEAWQERIVAHIQERPHGGNATDYEQWVRSVVSSVTRVWVFPLESGAGTIAVRFMMDGTYDDGIPHAGDVDLVQAYIDRPDVRPVTAQVLVAAPVAVPLSPQITIVPDTPSVRTAVETQLRDLLLREGAPDSTLLRTHVAEAVSAAAGETNHQLTSPTGDITYASTEIPVLGSITWGP